MTVPRGAKGVKLGWTTTYLDFTVSLGVATAVRLMRVNRWPFNILYADHRIHQVNEGNDE